ncbi:iron-sulfur cluster assembly accessory protein [Alkalinema sp. FACHB-956]|uniref:HesB/IscA family protein n=1 Tax=Alkalinema sp. FACHB-956 TaxID=2692768 RepID=UPI001686EBDA|nr:iron-sulfur cluster assembly accessory protein [Alkalinema sp. FACHB-956]MBD2328980.1 iron-sulfur cluster assembly accessory protein [Alkalinema sp. FACHB-956]
MVYLSAAALAEVKRTRQRQHPTAYYLRIMTQEGGCSGWSYRLTWCDSRASDDVEQQCEDITVIVSAAQWPHLEGLKVDYAEDLMGGNFQFDNPIATAVCGCGFSFSINSPS